MEYFKDIPGYEGAYQVSNFGRVLNARTGKILRPVLSKRFGYRVVSLSVDSKNKIKRIHRLVLAAFHGESDQFVNHKDFDRKNNVLANLEYCTAKENTQHAIQAGRHPSVMQRQRAQDRRVNVHQ